MHGVSRKAPTREEKEASSLKAAKLGELQSQLLHFHRNKIYTKEAIDISKNLLESNPEHYTGWNYRKLLVQQLLESAPDSDSVQSIVDEELRVVENALKRNFKSYGAWHHRKWILSKGYSSTDMEMRLLGKFQKLDARNFHAWNYRRFITALKKIPDEEELQYTMDMIYDNFSNYSAWHNRSMLLSRLLEAKGNESFNKANVFGEEFEFVRNALFTDPDDQSGWFYHLWLLDQTLKREPQLLSLWPPPGCNLSLSAKGFSDGLSSLPTLAFQSKDKKFPVVLYFSESVEGVSSSTVIIEYEYLVAGDHNWRPLSVNKSGSAQAWLTYLNFPDEVSSLKTYTLRVIIAEFPGITSSSGVSCSSFCTSFTVSGPSHDKAHTEVRTSERISPELMFQPYAVHFEDAKVLDLLSKLRITSENEQTASEWSMKTISNEIAHCQELLSTTNCKIGKLTLARLLMAQNTLVSYSKPNDSAAFQYEQILDLYRDLKDMDPSHSGYYEDQYSLALWKQMTSSMESLLKFCSECQESSSTLVVKPCLSLRLTGLSLSRLGSMEGLLWVQMLDLSHNQLQSIEGLEALQLLSYLNLSNNKICSFLALEPIRMLKSLEVLDISHNEIGAHSVDTRRYLCSSPLTNTVGNDWDFPKFTDGDIKAQVHWEAFVIFKELNLMQLEIAGNAIVDNHLKALLVKAMPTLRWLDGESCK